MKYALGMVVGLTLVGGSAAWGQEASLQELGQKIDRSVREELTMKWYPRVVDRERGGFHQTYARDWTALPDDNAFLVAQARLTWTAAAFAEYAPERREEYLGYARHGLAFLNTAMRDREQGGFHMVVGPDGKLDPKLGDQKHAYGIAFVIYGASVLKRVGGDAEALEVAQHAFDWLDSHAHDATHGGYFEALARDGTPILTPPIGAGPDARDSLGVPFGYKSMNSHIHLLEALAELVKVDPRPIVRRRLEEVHAIVRDRIAVEPGALHLFFLPDWRPVPGHDSFGHDIETAYLLVESAEALGMPHDPATIKVARQLVRHAMQVGWDAKNGGFYDKGDAIALPAYDTDKVWWTQAEGLNALALMLRIGGHEDAGSTYPDALRKQWEFIERHLIDPEHGGWYEEVTADGKLTGDGRKASQWKLNYHTARACMNVARWLK